MTNKMAVDDQNQEGKRREHYLVVSHNDALGRGNDANSTLRDEPAGSAANTSGAASPSGTANALLGDTCELNVYFDTDSSKLGPDSQQRLDRVADCMKRKEVDHATIVGQTDPSGTKEHNEQLGMERARVVAEYLRNRGVPEGDIRVRSKGELASAESRDLWPAERNAGVSTSKR